MSKPSILAFAGSARKGSCNFRLLQIAVEGARAAGADVTVLDLKDYPLPLFDEDLERSGTPYHVTLIKQLFLKHDGLLIASPEYNGSLTPLLKNVIDWVSRPAKGEGRLAAYQGKVAALMTAVPGGGGLRGLLHLREILSGIGVIVLPSQTILPGAFEAFDENGQLKDEKQQARLHALGKSLAETVGKLTD